MKSKALSLTLASIIFFLGSCTFDDMNFDKFPSTTISNQSVEMKIYLPDLEKGLYRASRFDWSGVIGSVKYKKHEYFGYWKDTHDPLFHEDLTGPVEGYIKPGLGYEEAEAGGKYIRIGVGIIEKDEREYSFRNNYKILDYGKWTLDQGEDWISFTHELESDIGYAYTYNKIIRLKPDGFIIEHRLQNKGKKSIQTDQFNHNFFMIDGESSGPAFKITFPYPISTEDDPGDLLELKDKQISFLRELQDDEAVFVELTGFSEDASDHRVTIVNEKSGAGASYTVDKPLYRMAFWACKTTMSPENFIWIDVEPGREESWTSEYTLFVNP
jgi:hypothetical protein